MDPQHWQELKCLQNQGSKQDKVLKFSQSLSFLVNTATTEKLPQYGTLRDLRKRTSVKNNQNSTQEITSTAIPLLQHQ
jgi:hypothetical protein